MKKIILILLIVLIVLLNGCGFAGYKHEGDIYLKSPKKVKKEEITEVLDLEIQDKEIDLTQSQNIVLLIGLGHKYDYKEDAVCELSINFNDNSNGNLVGIKKVYDDYNTEKYDTYLEKTIFKFLNKYPDFYPNYHEHMTIELPTNLTTGTLIIEMKVKNITNSLLIESLNLQVEYNVENNILMFKKSK